MKILRNENGFAFITALMITMICLVITMGILTVITRNTKSGGIKKSYQNAVEASYGGAELQMFEVMPKLLADIFAQEILADQLLALKDRKTSLTDAMAVSGINLAFTNNVDACLHSKLLKTPANWPADCADTAVRLTNTDPRIVPDFTLTLPGIQGQSYTVLSKIVDTSVGVQYIPPPPGGPMGGGGVAKFGGSGTSSLVSHYVYRIEVSASRSASDPLNPLERGAVSVLYEF
jgi:hypothetical protein